MVYFCKIRVDMVAVSRSKTDIHGIPICASICYVWPISNETGRALAINDTFSSQYCHAVDKCRAYARKKAIDFGIDPYHLYMPTFFEADPMGHPTGWHAGTV